LLKRSMFHICSYNSKVHVWEMRCVKCVTRGNLGVGMRQIPEKYNFDGSL
jgi:hypothetical protein